MSEGFVGFVEVEGRRYAAYSENETEERVKARIARQQIAAKQVLDVLMNKAVEHEVSPHSVLEELNYLTQEVNKGE